MANTHHNPNGLISYGPNENCTSTPGPQYCPVNVSVYEYRPSIAANSVFIALFGVALVIHFALGIRYRTWAFLFAIYFGCACELIGYGGRILMWKNVFSFPGFLIQASECLPRALALFGVVVQRLSGSKLREQFLTPDSLHHAWSGMVLSSHLFDLVENASTSRLGITKLTSG